MGILCTLYAVHCVVRINYPEEVDVDAMDVSKAKTIPIFCPYVEGSDAAAVCLHRLWECIHQVLPQRMAAADWKLFLSTLAFRKEKKKGKNPILNPFSTPRKRVFFKKSFSPSAVVCGFRIFYPFSHLTDHVQLESRQYSYWDKKQKTHITLYILMYECVIFPEYTVTQLYRTRKSWIPAYNEIMRPEKVSLHYKSFPDKSIPLIMNF